MPPPGPQVPPSARAAMMGMAGGAGRGASMRTPRGPKKGKAEAPWYVNSARYMARFAGSYVAFKAMFGAVNFLGSTMPSMGRKSLDLEAGFTQPLFNTGPFDRGDLYAWDKSTTMRTIDPQNFTAFDRMGGVIRGNRPSMTRVVHTRTRRARRGDVSRALRDLVYGRVGDRTARGVSVYGMAAEEGMASAVSALSSIDGFRTGYDTSGELQVDKAAMVNAIGSYAIRSTVMGATPGLTTMALQAARHPGRVRLGYLGSTGAVAAASAYMDRGFAVARRHGINGIFRQQMVAQQEAELTATLTGGYAPNALKAPSGTLGGIALGSLLNANPALSLNLGQGFQQVSRQLGTTGPQDVFDMMVLREAGFDPNSPRGGLSSYVGASRRVQAGGDVGIYARAIKKSIGRFPSRAIGGESIASLLRAKGLNISGRVVEQIGGLSNKQIALMGRLPEMTPEEREQILLENADPRVVEVYHATQQAMAGRTSRSADDLEAIAVKSATASAKLVETAAETLQGAVNAAVTALKQFADHVERTRL